MHGTACVRSFATLGTLENCMRAHTIWSYNVWITWCNDRKMPQTGTQFSRWYSSSKLSFNCVLRRVLQQWWDHQELSSTLESFFSQIQDNDVKSTFAKCVLRMHFKGTRKRMFSKCTLTKRMWTSPKPCRNSPKKRTLANVRFENIHFWFPLE